LKIEHIALASNSELESDNFFIDLLGLEKIRRRPLSLQVEENLTKAGVAFFVLLGTFIHQIGFYHI